MKNKGFGHLKTRWFTINTFKHAGLGGPMVLYIQYTGLEAGGLRPWPLKAWWLPFLLWNPGTPWKFNSSPLKIGHPKRKVIFQPLILRGELLNFGGVTPPLSPMKPPGDLILESCFKSMYWEDVPFFSRMKKKPHYGGGFKDLLFSGNDSQFDEHVFFRWVEPSTIV